MLLNKDINNKVLHGQKKAQLAVWDYVLNLRIHRNRLVHGDIGTSDKWITRLQEKPHSLKRNEPEISYRDAHLLKMDIDKIKYAEQKSWISRINEEMEKENTGGRKHGANVQFNK